MNLLNTHVSLIVIVLSLWSQAVAADFERSEEISFAGGKMVVAWTNAPTSTTRQRLRRELLIHFHGSADVVLREASRAKLRCRIVVLNFPGLSSAYRRPFETDSSLLEKILSATNAELQKANQTTISAEDSILLSSFSAGYGAVREILREPAVFKRIQGYIAADSIYASIVPQTSNTQAQQPSRLVDPNQMKGFLGLAKLAAKGEKFFLLTHSAQPTPYASTTETADFLIDTLSLRRETMPTAKEPSVWRPTTRCSHNAFVVLGYSGASATDHLQHLRKIGDTFGRIDILRNRHHFSLKSFDDERKSE